MRICEFIGVLQVFGSLSSVVTFTFRVENDFSINFPPCSLRRLSSPPQWNKQKKKSIAMTPFATQLENSFFYRTNAKKRDEEFFFFSILHENFFPSFSYFSTTPRKNFFISEELHFHPPPPHFRCCECAFWARWVDIVIGKRATQVLPALIYTQNIYFAR
jgi:hypothetical protein